MTVSLSGIANSVSTRPWKLAVLHLPWWSSLLHKGQQSTWPGILTEQQQAILETQRWWEDWLISKGWPSKEWRA